MLGRLRTRVLGAGRAEHTVGAAMTLLRQAAPPRAPDEAPHRRPPTVLSPAHDKWSAPGAKAQYSAIIPAHRVASGATTADKSHLLRCVGKLVGHSNRRLSRAFTDGKQAGTLSNVALTAKAFNERLDPKAPEAFVERLSEKAQAELLDLILKKRGEEPLHGYDDIFETGEAKIRIEDYEKLDTNNDGLISREELEAYIQSQQAPLMAPTHAQLTMLATSAAVPFVGFGFMDNAIMIIAGEAIEAHIGAILTVSTMGCAAIGNLISDVAGVAMGSYVEAVARKMGFKEPALTPEQMALGVCKYVSNIGAALGVALGCLLGMFPLLFLTDTHDGYNDSAAHESKS